MSKERLDWMPSAERLNQMLIYMINTYTDEKYGAAGDFETIKEDIMSAMGMSEIHFAAIQDELDFVSFAKEGQENHLVENEPIVVRTMDELKALLEGLGWQILEGQNAWLLIKTSPAGEDFQIVIHHDKDLEKAIREIKKFVFDFDVDKHAQDLIEARGKGLISSSRLGGLPSKEELVEDAVAIKGMLEEIVRGLVVHNEKSSLNDVLFDAKVRSGENCAQSNEKDFVKE